MALERLSFVSWLIFGQEGSPGFVELYGEMAGEQGIRPAEHTMSGTGPAIVFSMTYQVCPNRIPLDVASDREEVTVSLDGEGMEPFLKEVAANTFPLIHVQGKAPVRFANGPCERVLTRGHEDHVDVV